MMEWQIAMLGIFGTLLFLMLTGLPIAFCFMLANMIWAFLIWGGERGLSQFILSIFGSVTSFTLVAVPLFILMGDVMFRSGMGSRLIEALDKLLGRLPGRLGLLAVGSGTIFAVMSGSSMAGVALLGTVLVPEMQRRGYKTPMTIGPVIGSGGLAMIIPPSAMAVLLGSLGSINVGKLLIGGILPGLIIAFLYASYIIIRCKVQPSIAPSYELSPAPFSEKIMGIVKYVLPLSLILFLVLGLIFLGVTTPSEAAATGAFGAFILALCYNMLNWDLVKGSLISTIDVSIMLFTIVIGATAFSQILSFSGATRGLIEYAMTLPLSPISLVICMLVVILLLGAMISLVPIMMICLPVFMPVIGAMGFDPIWFGILMLVCLEMSGTTPPFGMLLFTMKGVAPRGTTMGAIIRAGIPFLLCDAIAVALCLAFPKLVTWLPGVMK